MGELKQDDEEPAEPWETHRNKLSRHDDFPELAGALKEGSYRSEKGNQEQRCVFAVEWIEEMRKEDVDSIGQALNRVLAL